MSKNSGLAPVVAGAADIPLGLLSIEDTALPTAARSIVPTTKAIRLLAVVRPIIEHSSITHALNSG